MTARALDPTCLMLFIVQTVNKELLTQVDFHIANENLLSFPPECTIQAVQSLANCLGKQEIGWTKCVNKIESVLTLKAIRQF